MRRILLLACAAALAAALASPARAEKADRDKPAQVEANRMTSDEARRVSIFEGNVVFTKGTLQLRAERVVLRQDADGFHHASASGAPVRFRQRTDAQPGQEGVWVEGEALRVEIDPDGGIRYRSPDKNAAREQAMKHFGLYERDNKQKPFYMPPEIVIVPVEPRRLERKDDGNRS